MGRGWYEPWVRFPASVPLPAEGGLPTSKQRGPMASTWWSKRFTSALESYGLGARMQRGRRYARSGQVLSLEVSPGVIAAQVQGSRRTPYLVTVSAAQPTADQWRKVEQAMAAKVGFAARLLGGEVPEELEEVFVSAGVPLFPSAWKDLRSSCTCPDWENPCKHIAAVLYVFADRLDEDPWLVLAFRGRGREELMAALTGLDKAQGARAEVAPWWPFVPGPLPVLPAPGLLQATAAPDRPDAVLDAMEPLDVSIGPANFVELLRPLYEVMTGGSEETGEP